MPAAPRRAQGCRVPAGPKKVQSFGARTYRASSPSEAKETEHLPRAQTSKRGSQVSFIRSTYVTARRITASQSIPPGCLDGSLTKESHWEAARAVRSATREVITSRNYLVAGFQEAAIEFKLQHAHEMVRKRLCQKVCEDVETGLIGKFEFTAEMADSLEQGVAAIMDSMSRLKLPELETAASELSAALVERELDSQALEVFLDRLLDQASVLEKQDSYLCNSSTLQATVDHALKEVVTLRWQLMGDLCESRDKASFTPEAPLERLRSRRRKAALQRSRHICAAASRYRRAAEQVVARRLEGLQPSEEDMCHVLPTQEAQASRDGRRRDTSASVSRREASRDGRRRSTIASVMLSDLEHYLDVDQTELPEGSISQAYADRKTFLESLLRSGSWVRRYRDDSQGDAVRPDHSTVSAELEEGEALLEHSKGGDAGFSNGTSVCGLSGFRGLEDGPTTLPEDEECLQEERAEPVPELQAASVLGEPSPREQVLGMPPISTSPRHQAPTPEEPSSPVTPHFPQLCSGNEPHHSRQSSKEMTAPLSTCTPQSRQSSEEEISQPLQSSSIATSVEPSSAQVRRGLFFETSALEHPSSIATAIGQESQVRSQPSSKILTSNAVPRYSCDRTCQSSRASTSRCNTPRLEDYSRSGRSILHPQGAMQLPACVLAKTPRSLKDHVLLERLSGKLSRRS
eukprot:TRINITY_DN5076_c0_g1_i1.p1 TRINITY_DN5076_c0_g1~~TRINITY_DN5076_c0_g1_i1.p1  ORF type:complete len:688 (-),score=114.98 TRINITY_DN5076_c0_g1_i1:200-2263(-)